MGLRFGVCFPLWAALGLRSLGECCAEAGAVRRWAAVAAVEPRGAPRYSWPACGRSWQGVVRARWFIPGFPGICTLELPAFCVSCADSWWYFRELCQVFVGEVEIARAEVFHEVLFLLGPRYRDDVVSERNGPCDRHLRGGRVVPFATSRTMSTIWRFSAIASSW